MWSDVVRVALAVLVGKSVARFKSFIEAGTTAILSTLLLVSDGPHGWVSIGELFDVSVWVLSASDSSSFRSKHSSG